MPVRPRSKASHQAAACITNTELPLSDIQSGKAGNDSNEGSRAALHRIPYYREFIFLVFCGLLLYIIAVARPPLTTTDSSIPNSSSTGSRNDSSGCLSPIVTRSIPLPWKPPVVYRSVLEKLDQTVSPPKFPISSHPGTRIRWPPSVTHIPEPGATHSQTSLSYHSPVPDVACISDISSCRFILPLKIGEQESKAQIHLLQILRLARALDRTLVLPNVGGSRLSACGKWDFGTYYDIEKLTSGETLPLVKVEEFQQWTRTRHPTAQLITIDSKKDRLVSQNSTVISRHNIKFDIDNNRDPADSKFISCLSTEFPRLDLSAFSPINIYPSEAGQAILKNASLGPLIVSALDDPDVQALASRISTPPAGPTTADVLLLDWNLRHPAFPTFPEAELSLEYSPHLIRLASSMAPPGSYLAVHWRMETIPPEKLPQCAHSLVERLSDILHEPAIGDGITTVWLATDYPHSDGHIDVVSKSSTFRNITPFHHTAMSIFQSAFLPRGPLETFNFTGLSEKLHSPRNGDDVLLQDSGVRGILDKVIAMRAALFVSGGNGCGKTSSYTKQIVQARKGYGKAVRNVVDMFG